MLPRPIRFLISGGTAAATEYIAFTLLYTSVIRHALLLSQTVSFLCGFVVSFLLNRLWVFGSVACWMRDLVRYSALAAINLVLSNGMILFLVGPASLVPLAAKLIVMIAVAAWNYVIFSRIIFRSPPRPDTQ